MRAFFRYFKKLHIWLLAVLAVLALFFALRGENFDGNDYALKALGDEHQVNFVLSLSADPEEMPDFMREYII